jgi:EAL domain-containing protein (putative c-di-GMP-specific phosphodiesterase class I)
MGLLAEIGCDIAQGYHITRAVPAPEFVQWLAKSGFDYAKKPQVTRIGLISQ